MRINLKSSRAFTLIEIIIAITIIAVFITLPMLAYANFNKNSRDALRKNDVHKVQSALELYKANTGTYPTQLNWMEELVNQGYLPEIPKDPKDGQDSDGVTFGYSYSVSSDGLYYELSALLESGEGVEKEYYVVSPGGPGIIGKLTPGNNTLTGYPTTTLMAQSPTAPFTTKSPTPTRTPTPSRTPTPTPTNTPAPGAVIANYRPASSNISVMTTDTSGKVWFIEDGNYGWLNPTNGTSQTYPAPYGPQSPFTKMAVDSSNNIWYVGGAGGSASKLVKINGTTGAATVYDGPSLPALSFGPAIGPDNAIWFAEHYPPNTRIYKYSQAGVQLGAYTTSTYQIAGDLTTVGAYLYFPSTKYPSPNEIVRLTTAGAVSTFSTLTTYPGSTVVKDPTNNMWSIGSNSVYMKTSTSGVTTNYPAISQTYSYSKPGVLGPDNNIWHLSNKTASGADYVRIKPDGSYTPYAPNYGFGVHVPNAIASSNGKIWIGMSTGYIFQVQPGN